MYPFVIGHAGTGAVLGVRSGGESAVTAVHARSDLKIAPEWRRGEILLVSRVVQKNARSGELLIGEIEAVLDRPFMFLYVD
jgi:hypothetical protein